MPLYLPQTKFQKGQALEVWGDARPAHFVQKDTKSPQRVKIQFQKGSSGSVQHTEDVPINAKNGYFDIEDAVPRQRHRAPGVGLPQRPDGPQPPGLGDDVLTTADRPARGRPPQLRRLWRVLKSERRGAGGGSVLRPVPLATTDRMPRLRPRPTMPLLRMLLLAAAISLIASLVGACLPQPGVGVRGRRQPSDRPGRDAGADASARGQPGAGCGALAVRRPQADLAQAPQALQRRRPGRLPRRLVGGLRHDREPGQGAGDHPELRPAGRLADLGHRPRSAARRPSASSTGRRIPRSSASSPRPWRRATAATTTLTPSGSTPATRSTSPKSASGRCGTSPTTGRASPPRASPAT